MGKRGPQKTPTAKLKLHGSWRANSRKSEPKPASTVPQCPDWLQGEARNIWKRMVPQLKAMGVMTKVDGFAFARYCIYGVLWMKELNNPGRTEATLERYANQLNRMEASFGMTPSARAGLTTGADKKDDDPLYAILNRKKQSG